MKTTISEINTSQSQNNEVFKTQIISVASGQLAYIDSGDKNYHQEIVLLLHGNSNSKEMFGSLFPSLVKQGYRCIAADYLGHGESGPAVNPEGYGYPDQAQAIAEFLEALKLEDVHIIGLSNGGHIGYELLGNDRLKSLITLGAPPVSKVLFEGNVVYDYHNWFTFAEEQVQQQVAEPFNIMELLHKNKFSQAEAEYFIQGAGITPTEPEYASQLAAAMNTHEAARPALMNACHHAKGSDQNQAIRNTEKKVCLLVGEHDHINTKNMEAFAESAGEHVSCHVIRDAQHYALYGSSKAAFLEIISQTLELHAAPSSGLGKGY